MSDHLTFQRTPSQFALLIAVPAEVAACLLAVENWPEKQKTHSACEWVESFRFVALATNSPLAQFLVGTKS